MKVLGIDSSAKSASVAITESGKVVSSFYINTGLTHSQTLMPMVENALNCADIGINDIDLLAVNKGPGSFTGIRIGVAAIKGIADVIKKPCIGISTLESIAYNLIDFNCIVCSVMDARCNQVYVALFDITDGKITRICEDMAISIDLLKNMLTKYKKIKFFVGDGAQICYNALGKDDENIKIVGDSLLYQNAVSVCHAAESYDSDVYCSGDLLNPEYLRLPQAQRELNNKLKK